MDLLALAISCTGEKTAAIMWSHRQLQDTDASVLAGLVAARALSSVCKLNLAHNDLTEAGMTRLTRHGLLPIWPSFLLAWAVAILLSSDIAVQAHRLCPLAKVTWPLL